MTCEGHRKEKFYAGLKLDYKTDKIIQLPQCSVCGGYIQ